MKPGKPSQNRTIVLNKPILYFRSEEAGEMLLRLNEGQFENSRLNQSKVVTYEKPKSKTMSNTFLFGVLC